VEILSQFCTTLMRKENALNDNKPARINAKDLAKVENNLINAEQAKFLLKRTPSNHIKTRPALGGGTWQYVSGTYVQKVLNLMFGWAWDFEIVSEIIQDGEAIVKGRLTVNTGGQKIIKTQYGNKKIMKKRNTGEALSLGNDLKAAATDALKKCAAQLGIAQDVYAPDEFTEVEVISEEQHEHDADILIKAVKEDIELLHNVSHKIIEKAIQTKNLDVLFKLVRNIRLKKGEENG